MIWQHNENAEFKDEDVLYEKNVYTIQASTGQSRKWNKMK